MLIFETINSKVPAQFVVIWLHGLGADGHDFMPIVPELKLSDLPIRFIFPHAPVRAVTLNRGMLMPAWFDIHEISPAAKHDEAGILKTSQDIEALLYAQHQLGIPYDHMVLVGFSQGGTLALFTALRFHATLAGVMGLSTFLPMVESLKSALENPKPLPIFLAHGTMDPIVPIEIGQMTEELLSTQGYTVDWHTYSMAHQVCAEEIQDISLWLRARFIPSKG